MDALDPYYFPRRLEAQYANWHSDYAYAFLIFKREDNSLIGGMNINQVTRAAAQFASLGYWIDQDHEGKGYMAEAMELTIDYCFKNLRLHRINAACMPHNEKSKKLLLRMGFIEEGFAKEFLQIDGVWQDHILYGLIRPKSLRMPDLT
jgi:ribosomal-protein-alanine N-acetyltransferase